MDKVKYYIKLISNIIIFYILNLYFDLLYLKNILYLLHTITHKLSNDNYMYRTFKLEAFEFVIVMYLIYFTVTFNFNTILVEIFNFQLIFNYRYTENKSPSLHAILPSTVISLA